MDFVRELVAIAKALSDLTRVRIIAALRNGELCVCELVDALSISQSSLSSHLQVCREAGILTTRKESRWIYYSLSTRYEPLIERIFSELQAVGNNQQVRQDARRLNKRL
jgi:ArsR family transcriptional regulator, arsenate/arsenite/antimonite-responsive transcriptional repressor